MTRKKTPVILRLMSGAEAKNPENVLKSFEQIKGRRATAKEIADLMALQPPKSAGSENRH
jgi:hypothetical protein